MALGFVCVVSLFAYFLGVRPYLDTQKEIAAQKVAAERERVALITRQQEQESQRRAEAERSRLELVARQQDEARRQADERSREQERLRMEGQQRRVQLAQAESVQQARAMQNSQAALAARTETLRVKCEQGKTARRTNDPARVPACIQHQEMAQQQRFKAAAAAGVATEAVACNPRTQRC